MSEVMRQAGLKQDVKTERLVEYLRGEAAFPCEIRQYTSAQKLMEDPGISLFRLIVIAQSQYDEAVKNAGFENLLLLNESDEWMEKPENISKYQSITNIAAYIRTMSAAGETPVVSSLRHGSPMIRIGVYSPVSRCLQTTFTLTLGQILAARRRVLYMNFEAFSGLEKMLSREFEGSVSDLIYYNECAREKLAGQLEMMTEEVGGLHFLPPMKSFIELRAIRKEQWSSLFRTISAHENDPAVIVQNMNDSMSETNETNMFVTFLAGALDLTDGTLRYCNAGHNAPLIMSPHKTRFMDVVSNIPLGIVEGMFYQEQETKLAAGEGIFLYTDGLTEAENVRKELFGEDRLLSLAAETAALTVEEQVGRISQAVKDHMGTEPQSDDLTMLSFKYQGDPHTFRYQLKLRNNLSEIPKIETFVNEVASVAGIQDHLTTSSINLALEEAITNVIMYAYPSGIDGPVYLEAVISEGKATFILSDTGKPFDPTKAEEVDVTLAAEDRPIGGLGIHLVRTIMDSVSYEYLSGKNILMMTKNL